MTDSKNRKPDYIIQLITKDSRGRDRFRDVGELWEGNNGYKSGESVAGRIVVQPRSAREELEYMRGEEKDRPDQENTYEQSM